MRSHRWLFISALIVFAAACGADVNDTADSAVMSGGEGGASGGGGTSGQGGEGGTSGQGGQGGTSGQGGEGGQGGQGGDSGEGGQGGDSGEGGQGGGGHIQCSATMDDCDEDGLDCEQSLSDPEHCGACNTPCELANAEEQICASAECRIVSCQSNYRDCNGKDDDGCEASILTDPDHCGSCRPCVFPNAVATCNNGTCVMGSCEDGFEDCNQMPEDGCERPVGTITDCATCDDLCTVANGTPACEDGACVVAECVDGTDDCNGRYDDGCEQVLNTLTHCGECNQACDQVTCSAQICTDIDCTASAPYSDCNGVEGDGPNVNGCETNLHTLEDCGYCDTPCDILNASEQCSTGVCTRVACNSGFMDCDGDAQGNCETDGRTNPNRCGSCSVDCAALPNVQAANVGTEITCAAGACVIGNMPFDPADGCNSGFADCDGNAPNGCEASLTSGVATCGACNNDCRNLPAVVRDEVSCSFGACVIDPATGCQAGYSDCNNNAADGCEINTRTSVQNCGGCGAAFACSTNHASDVTCSTSGGTPHCQINLCDAGWSDCDRNPANGCETSLSTNTNCGACNRACADDSSTDWECNPTSRTCQVAGCNGTFYDCDVGLADGCETNLANNVNNCGMCDRICAYAHAGASCSSGMCQMGTCDAAGGWANCDNATANGCESNTGTDRNHCGGCGHVCGTQNTQTNGATCSGGQCDFVCQAGYLNCGGRSTDEFGCASSIYDPATCGSCTFACPFPANQDCNGSGVCTDRACSAGLANCDANPDCETTVVNNNADCGRCDNNCTTLYSNGIGVCSNTSCQLTGCVGSFRNCDNSPGNGCEANITNDESHCGACNTPCTFSNGIADCNTSMTPSCRMTGCVGSFRDCNNNAGLDGCEINISTNVSHCGNCGMPCNFQNATGGTCGSGNCMVGTCNQNFANCNNNGRDGCEINLQTSNTNCGSCGHNCANDGAGFVCDAGECVNPAGVRHVESGQYHMCAVKYNGEVYCWGDNFDDTVGVPGMDQYNAPVKLTLGAGVLGKEIHAAPLHACTVTTSGAAYCWGLDLANGYRMGLAPTNGPAFPSPFLHPNVSAALNISTAMGRTCIMVPGSSGNTVRCLGGGSSGELGNGSNASNNQFQQVITESNAAITNVVQLDTSETHSCAVLSDGRLLCWGLNDAGQLGVDRATTNCGSPTICRNRAAQVSFGAGSAFVRKVAVGYRFTCAVVDRANTGEVWCWGANQFGQLAQGTASAAGAAQQTPLRALVCLLAPSAGAHFCSQVAGGTVPVSFSGAIDIDASNDNVCAIYQPDSAQEAGRVMCWGHNDNNQSDPRRSGDVLWASPVATTANASIRDTVEVAAGLNHACALHSHDTATQNATCWGQGDYGALGSGGVNDGVQAVAWP